MMNGWNCLQDPLEIHTPYAPPTHSIHTEIYTTHSHHTHTRATGHTHPTHTLDSTYTTRTLHLYTHITSPYTPCIHTTQTQSTYTSTHVSLIPHTSHQRHIHTSHIPRAPCTHSIFTYHTHTPTNIQLYHAHRHNVTYTVHMTHTNHIP